MQMLGVSSVQLGSVSRNLGDGGDTAVGPNAVVLA